MCKYKIGDTVRLKSGGPCMTISGVEPSKEGCLYDVNWFDDKTKELKEYEGYHEDMLVPCNDGPLPIFVR